MNEWKRLTKEVRQLREKQNELYSYMTTAERMSTEGNIETLKHRYERAVIDGVVSDWNVAKQGVLTAQERVKAEIAAERRRWDDTKLSASLQSVKLLTDQAFSAAGGDMREAAKRLDALYQDYYGSGDLHKQRAAVEMFSGLRGKSLDEDGILINQLATQARRDAAGLRTTPSLQRAHEEMAQAVEGLNAAEAEIVQADKDMGWSFPNGEVGNFALAKTLGKVVQDENQFFTFDGEMK